MGGALSAPVAELGSCLTASIPSDLVALPTKLDFWISDVKPYNLRIPVKPVAIIHPKTNDHVSAAVKCAGQVKVKVQAKSGGHSYGNFAYGGGENNAMVIDMKNMKGFSWDASGNWVAHVGSGNLLGNLTKAMKENGNRAFAHGVCPSVGIGGHATMGGLGPASRMWGTALDHVQSVTVVTADGSIKKASLVENADLLWAIKGAGASFGVVTEFDIITRAPPEETTLFSYSFGGLPFVQHAERLKAWQAMAADPGLSRKFASEAFLTPLGLIISGTYFGPKTEFDQLNITSVFPKATSGNTVVLHDWAGQVAKWAEQDALVFSDNIPNAFYAKSLVFTKDTLIPDDGITKFLEYIDRTDKGTLLWFVIFDLAGGATNDIATDATAYGHRDALFYYQPYVSNTFFPLQKSSVDFLEGLTKTLTEASPGVTANGAYAGYVDAALGTGAQAAYWGKNYARLQELKGKYDPTDMFRNPQSVRLPGQ